MTDSIKEALHHQQVDTKPIEVPVEMEDQKMEKVVGGTSKPVYAPKNKLNGDSRNEDDDILLPEIE
ncbi:MAG: hypothetical protein ACSW8J_10655 [bacterium]